MLDRLGQERIRCRLQSLDEDRDTAVEKKSQAHHAFVDHIRTLTDILDHSPTGRSLLRTAMLADVSVGLDPLLEAHAGFFYPAQNHLDLGYQATALQKTQKGTSLYLASLTGGLRRIWHHTRGILPDTALQPEEFLRYTRAAEADIDAITHLVAWELRGAGPCFLWRHLLAGVDGDITVSFARTASSHPRHQFDGTALRSAFLQWFTVPERVDACDHQALEIMDMTLLHRQEGQPVGKYRLDRDSLHLLGRLPQGGNYLAGMRFRAPQMRRPCDPFNRTHLRHIEKDIAHLSENMRSF